MVPSIENTLAVPCTKGTGACGDGTVLVKFTARDAASSIERAQYSVDGGDWILVAPTSAVSDAPEEHYQFSLSFAWSGPAAGEREHTIAVRAYDRFEKVGSAKTTFTVPPAKP